jgi:hypothetical protein
MTPRRNYGFERRRKEEIRRTRQEAKRDRKAERAEGVVGPEMGEAQESGPPPGQWEWFSPSRGRVVVTEPKQRPPADPPDDWTLLTEGVSEETDAPDASAGTR